MATHAINTHRTPRFPHRCTRVLLPFLLLLALPAGRAEGQTFPFQDTTLGVAERVEDLLSRLTLDEKLSMMEHRNPAIPSLGVPAYSWWNEALHGVGRNGLATVWPMPIALAATFNSGKVVELFANVAYEARRKYLAARSSDTCTALREPTDYTGLTFFTPNINIFRDPRWGRGMETYGEDPYLTARMGLACVQGLQFGGRPAPAHGDAPLLAAACLKHLAVHSGPEGIRHEFDAEVSPRDLWTTYLPAFEYIVKHSDVQQVMCGYNRLNGEPCCTNNSLLNSILRKQWHYRNLIVTDCWALNDCWERDTVIPRHKTHATAALTAAAAFGGEVDLECGSGLDALRTAADSGYISEMIINEHVRRILTTRLRVEQGLRLPDGGSDLSPVRMAEESTVLLRNQGVLPLKAGARIYLAGPNAEDTLMPLGNYNGTPQHTVSIREGLERYFTLVDKPCKADVIVYAAGLNPQLEGEELPVDMPGFYKGDRTRIELPDNQSEELRKLQRKHKPVVLLLCSGSAIALDRHALRSKAIVACWYGGEAMGEAVARTLAGKHDHFGRLPVTFYKSTQQLPPFEDYSMAGRTYRYMTEEPQFPFGYGLNYATFSLGSLRLQQDGMVTGTVSCTDAVTDSASTVVQVYFTNPDDPQGPRKTLVGFQKITVGAGQTVRFAIPIEYAFCRQFDEATGQSGRPHTRTPQFYVGFSSADADLTPLNSIPLNGF